MRRFAVPGLITLLAAGLVAVLAFGVAHLGTDTSLQSQVAQGARPVAPNAQMPLPVLGSTKTSTLASLRGKVVMINVFAGWCDACQQEAAVLRHAQTVLKRHGGTILGITYQDSSTDAISYMHRYGLSFPALRDPNGDFVGPYGVNGVPETFVINPEGKVEAVRTYQLTAGWVNRTLDRVLGLST